MTSQVSESVYRQYINALLQGNTAECKSIIQTLLKRNLNILDLYESVFRRSLYEIGELWAKNLITVADEHVATAITENLIAQLQTTHAGADTIKKRVMISCVTSDLHQVGAKMVANLFELHGWESYFLGANMPITDLLDAVDRIRPDIICLSLALIEHVSSLEITIREIQSKHSQIPVIVGGRAFVNLDMNSCNLNRYQNAHILHSVLQLEQFISGLK